MGPRQLSRGILGYISVNSLAYPASMGPRQLSRGITVRAVGILPHSCSASMGPRQLSRGITFTDWGCTMGLAASMGPRQLSRGINAPKMRELALMVLQWGHGN